LEKGEVMKKNFEDRIEINPKVMLGKPVIKGTRIPVYLILELYAGGYSSKKILKAYPRLTEEDLKAALWYASQTLKNEEIREYTIQGKGV
jgi:uncharacterized protein (DUF433 family)